MCVECIDRVRIDDLARSSRRLVLSLIAHDHGSLSASTMYSRRGTIESSSDHYALVVRLVIVKAHEARSAGSRASDPHASVSHKMPRFVILHHDHPFVHWDFLLENGKNCRTWRLLSEPTAELTACEAEALPEHRLFYLDYEGPVSGDRGTVTRIDAGTFEWQFNQPTRCQVLVQGQICFGTVQLEQTSGDLWTCRVVR